VPDLDDEKPACAKMERRLRDDAPHEVQAVASAGEREARFPPVFGGQRSHGRFAHVRRVRHDEIVATRAERREEIGGDELHAARHSMVRDVDARHVQRVGGEIGCIDARIREGQRRQDRKAPRPRAQIEHAPHVPPRWDPWTQIIAQQLRDERAWDEHALVDVEAMLPEPGLVHEVGGRFARADPRGDQRFDVCSLLRRHSPVEMRRERIERQLQRVQKEPRRFVAGIRCSVAIRDARGLEPPHDLPQDRAQSRLRRRARHATRDTST
jgi:hypothetical protein